MAGPLPVGEPVPDSGPIDADTCAGASGLPMSVYLHVPFCNSRCGYCDFNTYTADELGPGVSRSTFADSVVSEIAQAHELTGSAPSHVPTIFIGGGTPTLLSVEDLARMVAAVDAAWGLSSDAEITCEANPDTVNPDSLRAMRDAGINRISFGMQSVSSNVLKVLERTHTRGRALEAIAEAKAAGFDHVNVDLIYGTPGETDQDFADSLKAAIDSGVDHVSAYSLIVEDGTRLAARISRGELAYPDDDVAAERYELADEMLSAAGFDWYEVSNWAKPGGECQHNLAYWRSANWWGFGPGAHSHVGGVRWWNVKHPVTYATALAEGRWPAAGREILSTEDRHVEDILLRVRLVEGLPTIAVPGRSEALATMVGEGLLDGRALLAGTIVLTRRGRLLADAVARQLLAD